MAFAYAPCAATSLDRACARDGGFISGTSLLHGAISVGYFQANLILELLAPHLSLPDLRFIANGSDFEAHLSAGQAGERQDEK